MKAIFDDPVVRRYRSVACVYAKGNIICNEGEACEAIGFVASGSLELVHYDPKGNRVILAILKANELFGDFLIHSDVPNYPGYLVSREESAVIFLNKEHLDTLLNTHAQFRSIYLNYLSKKALSFSIENKMLKLKTLRERILFYIRMHGEANHPARIYIENKETLSEILNVRRPSLSRELSNMAKEGLITYDRYTITLLE